MAEQLEQAQARAAQAIADISSSFTELASVGMEFGRVKENFTIYDLPALMRTLERLRAQSRALSAAAEETWGALINLMLEQVAENGRQLQVTTEPHVFLFNGEAGGFTVDAPCQVSGCGRPYAHAIHVPGRYDTQ